MNYKSLTITYSILLKIYLVFLIFFYTCYLVIINGNYGHVVANITAQVIDTEAFTNKLFKLFFLKLFWHKVIVTMFQAFLILVVFGE